MSIHIIVDGYNMIRQSKWFSSLDYQSIQLGRDALIDALVTYKELKGHDITIVFDGIDMSFASRQKYTIKGVKIKFSRSDDSADQLIKDIVIKEKQKALVVSCDREVIVFAESCNASIIDSYSFGKKVLIANNLLEEEFKQKKNYNKIKFLTRKKGTSKKLSRNKRKHQCRINKL